MAMIFPPNLPEEFRGLKEIFKLILEDWEIKLPMHEWIGLVPDTIALTLKRKYCVYFNGEFVKIMISPSLHDALIYRIADVNQYAEAGRVLKELLRRKT